jgi:hypothetical protein
MNLVFTWDPSRRSLKVARSGGDIGRGGMGADALAAKFAGRGNVEEAFNSAFKVLEDAVGALQWRTAESVFGKNGNVWYSIEVIYTANPNAINYDSNNIVFHGWPIFEVQKDGAVARREDASGVDILSKNIERMQKAVSMRDWRVRGPSLVNLKKISDVSVLCCAVSAIDSALSTAGVSDDATIGEYLLNMMKQELEPLGLPPGVLEGTCMRALGFSGAPTVNDLKKKLTSKEAKAAVADAVKSGAKLQKKFVLPIEKAIQRFAVEVLRGLKSTLIDESDAEVVRLRGEVERAIEAIRASGDETAMSIVNAQLEKLGSVENISAAMEGVVFFYKGNAYKFTGAFAPASQILGILKYGRGGTKAVTSESREISLLKDAVRAMLKETPVSSEFENDVISAIRDAGIPGNIAVAAGASAVAPDADFTINGVTYNLEIKLNSEAQMGGGSVGWNQRDGFYAAGRTSESQSAVQPIADALNAERNMSIAVSNLVDFINAETAREGIKKRYSGFPMTGVLKSAWTNATKAGMLVPLNKRIASDVSFIFEHYMHKGTFYIQIGGAGLFYLSSNPANLPIPRLSGDVRLEVRAVRGGSSGTPPTATALLRVQARLLSVGSSPYSMDDPESIKRMISAMKRSVKTTRAR